MCCSIKYAFYGKWFDANFRSLLTVSYKAFFFYYKSHGITFTVNYCELTEKHTAENQHQVIGNNNIKENYKKFLLFTKFKSV